MPVDLQIFPYCAYSDKARLTEPKVVGFKNRPQKPEKGELSETKRKGLLGTSGWTLFIGSE